MTSICLPMRVSKPYDLAYLLTLLLFNGSIFVLICFCYVHIYFAVNKSPEGNVKFTTKLGGRVISMRTARRSISLASQAGSLPAVTPDDDDDYDNQSQRDGSKKSLFNHHNGSSRSSSARRPPVIDIAEESEEEMLVSGKDGEAGKSKEKTPVSLQNRVLEAPPFTEKM